MKETKVSLSDLAQDKNLIMSSEPLQAIINITYYLKMKDKKWQRKTN